MSEIPDTHPLDRTIFPPNRSTSIESRFSLPFSPSRSGFRPARTPDQIVCKPSRIPPAPPRPDRFPLPEIDLFLPESNGLDPPVFYIDKNPRARYNDSAKKGNAVSLMKNPGKVGIYCLANDKVLEWMIAFLESVRTHEPDLPIYIVPFDDNISKLTQISQKYKFEFYRDNTLETLDKIGAKVRGIEDIHNHRFRIFSIFWGPLDHFIFLDSDIVVLDSLQELFQTYLDTDFEFMYYYRGIFDQVYKSGEFRSQMIREYNANGFNAGSFLSSKGVFSLEDIDKIADRAATIRQHFADNCIVQPFVNYCVDIQRLKTEAIADAIPDIGSEWAKFPIEKVGETYRVNGQRIFYTHWAGFGYGPAMPNRDLFLQYRLKSQSWFSRYRYLIGEHLRILRQTWRSKISKTVKSFFNPSGPNPVRSSRV